MDCKRQDGPHPNAPLRTAQFVIERICPEVNKDPDDAALARLPMVVWVYLEEAYPTSGPLCGARYYALTAESSLEVMGRIHSGISMPLVCEHMGRLIE